MLLTLAAFIVTVGVIVIIHEFGHFVAARLTGMRVKRFSIGFPPKMLSRKIGQTEWMISWIPLGGYVQIAGMVDESLEEDGITGAPDEFMSKNPLQKTFVLSAGVLMNYLLAFVLVAMLTAVYGVGEIEGTTVGDVIPDMPAAAAGVQVGDRIVAVNSVETPTWRALVTAIGGAGDTVRFTLERATGESVELLIPTKASEEGPPRRVVGIVPKTIARAATPGEVVNRGWSYCSQKTTEILRFFGGLVTGRSSFSDLAGPIGMARLSGETARLGPSVFLQFIAFVSVSIGFLNILPLPVLDGGHIVYVIVEAIRKRPIPTRVKLRIQQAGMALLLALVVAVSYHDILRIFSN